jgi:hypothetical protein
MSSTSRSTARRALGLAALSGLGLTAAPAAHATTQSAGGLGATRLYPLAHTPLDVLSNNLHVPVGGMDLSTFPVTAPFRDGLMLKDVPIAGDLLP